MIDQQNKFLFFGYGYVAKNFSNELAKSNFIGTTRKPSGSQFIKFDESTKINKDILYAHTHILISIPPNENEDLVLYHHTQDLIKHPNLKWIGYLSSTGIYGDKKGAWVNENSKCAPTEPTNIQRFKAEQSWLKLYSSNGLPVHIFRLSGIYGPGRNMIESVKKGTAKRIDLPGQYFSRIHVADITNILQASINLPNHGNIYNCADDYPCPSKEILEYVCDELRLPYPVLLNIEDADLSPMAKRFYASNRRVLNDKIKNELNVNLTYSTFKEGYANFLAIEKK